MRVVQMSHAKLFQRAEKVRIAMFAALFLVERPKLSFGIAAERFTRVGSEIAFHAVVVEQGIVHVEQEDDRMRFGHG